MSTGDPDGILSNEDRAIVASTLKSVGPDSVAQLRRIHNTALRPARRELPAARARVAQLERTIAMRELALDILTQIEAGER